MRKIKFRALKKGTWYIFDFKDSQRWSRELLEEMAKNDYLLEFETPFLEFTGRKDKSNKEIYENDLIKIDLANVREKIFLVHWSDSQACWKFGEFNYATQLSMPPEFFAREENDQRYEVIGNIYENPELLNQ